MRLMPASTMSEADPTLLAPTVVRWYSTAARDLPWRRPDAGPRAVLVSEVMLQQTPVRRVLPTYTRWLARWPTAADLAAASAGRRCGSGAAWGTHAAPCTCTRWRAALAAAGPERTERERALASLVADGLLVVRTDSRHGLP